MKKDSDDLLCNEIDNVSAPLRGRCNSVPKNIMDTRVDKVYTVGCFDSFHAGHITLLQRMRALGKLLVMDSPSDMEASEESHALNGSLLDVSHTEEIASDSNSFVCPDCQKSFSCKRNLTRHRKAHNHNPYRCSDCNIYYKDAADLEKHQELKHACNVCEVCGKTFPRLRDLRLHLKIHNSESAESSLICPFEKCRKVFFRKTKYQDHLNTHTKSKPYQCRECTRDFSSRYGLREHEAVCTKQVTIRCDVCGKTFGYKSSLYNHKKAEHSTRSFVCGCGASFKYRSGLIRHTQNKEHP